MRYVIHSPQHTPHYLLYSDYLNYVVLFLQEEALAKAAAAYTAAFNQQYDRDMIELQNQRRQAEASVARMEEGITAAVAAAAAGDADTLRTELRTTVLSGVKAELRYPIIQNMIGLFTTWTGFQVRVLQLVLYWYSAGFRLLRNVVVTCLQAGGAAGAGVGGAGQVGYRLWTACISYVCWF